jgi:hypothetical protein
MSRGEKWAELKEWRKSAELAIMAFLVLVFVFLLASILLPPFLYINSPRSSARRTACINNLRQIDGAKDQYALEYGPVPPGTVLTTSEIAIYIKDMDKCFCPLLAGTNRTFKNSYSINDLTSAPTCKVGTNENHQLAYAGQ